MHDIEVVGAHSKACRFAIDSVLSLLDDVLPERVKTLLAGTKITIAEGLIASGGQAIEQEKKIILDTAKNALSLNAAEKLLVEAGYLEPGDWTKALPDSSDKAWSCLTYQLVHEFGHLIDGLSSGTLHDRLSTQCSPTKYGKTNPSECFAEAFAYWVFGLDLSTEAKSVLARVVS